MSSTRFDTLESVVSDSSGIVLSSIAVRYFIPELSIQIY
jgi:hypothetical protein